MEGAAASTTASPETKQKDKIARDFASAILTGTVIGRTLRDALDSVVNQDAAALNTGISIQRNTSKDENDDDDEIDDDNDSESDISNETPPVKEVVGTKPPPRVTLDYGGVDAVLNAFQEGAASSYGAFSNRHHQQQPNDNETGNETGNIQLEAAPRALLRGRCDFYNRFGANWMIAMDEVALKARPTKFTKRRRDDRPSLWDRDDDDGGTDDQKEVVLTEPLRLLAYGDRE